MLRTDLTAAFMLLTRLPAARFAPATTQPDLARAVWAFPVVGLVIGLAAGLSYWLAFKLRLPPLLAAAWTLPAALLLTGALHEDGLADTADGFGGGTTPARKLEIMRDSRIGTYGALALLLSCLIRITAIAAIARPAAVITALVLAGIAGRAAMVLPLLLLPPARQDGLGAALGRPPANSATLALALAAVAPFACLPPAQATAIIALAAAAALATARLAAAQIGGYTGDTLGATEVAVECVVLTVLAAA